MSLAASTDLLYGVHPVLEALRAKDVGVHRIYLQEGRRGRTIEEILRLAKARHVPVAFEARGDLDRRGRAGRDQRGGGVAPGKGHLSPGEVFRTARRREPPPLPLLYGVRGPPQPRRVVGAPLAA